LQSPGLPLEINHVSPGGSTGVIAMCCCPGRIERHVDGIQRQRDLEEDLLIVKDWSPDQVISLVEFHEFEGLGVPELPKRFESDFNWLHWPIRDLDAPSDSSRSVAAFANWEEALVSGKRLLFHCAAGLGRTGTLAARLLIATGVSPHSAIEAVRSARPGTVESPEQERFLIESA